MTASKNPGIGKTYDLFSLFHRLNRIYFDGKLNCEVQWSQRSIGRAKRRIILGTYKDKLNRITLSRRLDRPDVPLFFVEHILFHEMLHAVFPREKHRMHTEKFLKFERMHPDFDRALEWEKKSIKILFESSQKKLGFIRSAASIFS